MNANRHVKIPGMKVKYPGGWVVRTINGNVTGGSLTNSQLLDNFWSVRPPQAPHPRRNDLPYSHRQLVKLLWVQGLGKLKLPPEGHYRNES